MEKGSLRILLVDDDEDDYLITRDLLADIETLHYTLDWRDTFAAGLQTLRDQQHDIYLLDYQLGGHQEADNGLDLLQHAVSIPIQAPIIMLTGVSDHAVDAQSMQAGAADYLIKGQITTTLLERSIRHALERQKLYQALRQSEERYAIAAQGANDGLWDWNINTGEVYFSPRWHAQLGLTASDVGTTIDEWLSRIHPTDIERVEENLNAHLQGISPTFETEHRLRHNHGGYRWMLVRGFAVRDTTGQAYRMAGWQTDTSDRIAAYDGLTNLPNRTLFQDRLRRSLAHHKRQPTHSFAVLFLDIDGFKVVNDSLGHAVGDRMLIEIGRRLEELLRANDLVGRLQSSSDNRLLQHAHTVQDTIARFGGDEFAILADDITSAQDAIRIAERIQHIFTQPFSLAGHTVFSNASIGIALSHQRYDRAEDLLRDADIAMYKAKASGKAKYALFDADMYLQIKDRLALETDLRQALERNELSLHYQPIVLTDGTLCGFEALARWHHPDRGWVAPAEFIPLAEESELIMTLGRWVLTEACQQLRHWQETFPQTPPLSVSVNVSGKQLGHGGLVNEIDQILQSTSLDANTLAIEVTEGTLTANAGIAIEELEQLRERGVRVYIDDFGTGYSSLSRLRELPADALKIDRSFVQEMSNDLPRSDIIDMIARLGRALGLEVIAEGVETAEQLVTLASLQCPLVQGYHIAKPLSAATVMEIFKARMDRGRFNWFSQT